MQSMGGGEERGEGRGGRCPPIQTDGTCRGAVTGHHLPPEKPPGKRVMGEKIRGSGQSIRET